MTHKGLAVVTGASSGIGRETARALASEGYRVLAAARRRDRLEALAQEFPGIAPYPVDFADTAPTEAFCRTLVESPEPVSVLINNAGYAFRGVVEDVPIEDTRRLFQVNLFSPIRVIQTCLPGMRRARSGFIANISSVAGLLSFPCNGNYSATKHALEAYTESLRLEVAPFNIRVVTVRPGPIATEFSATAGHMTGDRMEHGPEDYRPIYQAMTGFFARLFGAMEVPGPEAVRDTILEALHDPAPRRGYPVGPMAGEYLPLRKRLTEEEWDRFVTERLAGKPDEAPDR